ncbi:hypothetical protein AB0G00_16555 [Nocardia salmonicida]|uniref:hypothetical protein n=1 Tax=Nocardia salmonicida TaxID=53431 RepID=UPI0033D0C5B3
MDSVPLAITVTVPPDFAPEVWSAIAEWIGALAACATAAIALVTVIVAGTYAQKQVGEMRTLREEQAQPYVVAVMDVAPERPGEVDFVIRNYGTTGAHDIRVSATPPLTRTIRATGDEAKPLNYPEAIPFLAPGQEWRTLWDYGPHRLDSALDQRYEIVVMCKDSKGKPMPVAKSLFDWGTLANHTMRDPKSMRQLVEEVETLNKSVDEIGKALKKT